MSVLYRISAARIRAVWDNSTDFRTMSDAAAHLGMSRSALLRRSKNLGLPPRMFGGAQIRPDQRREFIAMWGGGVSLAAMGQYFGIHPLSVAQNVTRMGLTKRRRGGNQAGLTVAAWRSISHQDAFAKALRVAAKVEQAAIIRAEMADHVPLGVGTGAGSRVCGSQHARGLM